MSLHKCIALHLVEFVSNLHVFPRHVVKMVLYILSM